MKRELISFDWAMKGILRKKSNFDILSGFFSELLGRTVEVQDLLESESNTDRAGGKINRLDLRAKIDGGEIVVFELQFDTQSDFFHRLMWGTGNAVVEQIGIGDDFEKIQKVYSVAVVYFELGKGNDYVYHGSTDFKGVHIHDTLLLSKNEMKYLSQPIDGEPRAGALFPEYYIIYPKRFDGQIRSTFDEWVSVFKTSKVESHYTAAGIQKAGVELDVRNMSDEEYVDYKAYIKAERVRSNEISTAIWRGEQEGLKKGKAEGKAEGRQEAFIEIAKNMKAKGKSVDEIADMTGLSTDDIGRL